MKKIVVLGGGISGYGSAILAKKKGFDVFLSDKGRIADRYKAKLDPVSYTHLDVYKRQLYILFILAGLLIFARLVWVQLFSSEVAYNAERLAGRIFTEQIIPAQRGNILTRDGDPLATSIFRYRVEFRCV